MKKILILLILFIPFNTFSLSYIVIENNSGKILYSKNPNNRNLIASITKIMTCIVTIENSNLNKKVKVDNEVLKMYGTNIYIEVGEELTIRDLLYGLMLRSGNDASVTLAKTIGGSEEGFVHLMNDKAKSIGMKNTIFKNPHGLDEETENYSTPKDMSLLARYAYKNKIYRNIISTKKYTTKSSLKSYIWYNRMSLLNNYKWCIGGKNGYTPRAGKTLVSYAKKNNMILISVSLNDGDIYKRHENLFEKAFKEYKLYKVIDKNNFNSDDYYIKKSLYYPLNNTEKDNIKLIVKYGDSITATLNNKTIGKVNMYKKNKKKRLFIR